jgi:hypothetical protein
MRKVLAVLLAGLFLILFLIAVTVNQVVDTASDPEVIIGMIDDAQMYDYVYENIIGSLVHDMVSNGIEIDSGLGDSAAPTVLTFDDPDAATLAITSFIETIVPREYVKAKIEEGMEGIVPYVRGDVDTFTLDLEVQGRVREVPNAARQVVSDLDLTERVIEDLLIPQLDSFGGQISGKALGINLTDAEIESAARRIFAAEWLEGQLFGAIDEITPYFAGDADSFSVELQFGDRAVIIGQVLKDKLVKQDTLYNLVFAQVVGPLIQQTVAQSSSVGFGISLTEAEVVDSFEVIAPRQWVQNQGEGVIDALVAYMVGETYSLAYRVDLADRKIAAATELEGLALRKLEVALDGIPVCGDPTAALGAAQDIRSQQLPRCIAGGQPMIDLALNTFAPVMAAQVVEFVDAQVPSEVSYSQADFESQIGGSLESVDEIREQIAEGFSFSDRDLVNMIASDSSRRAQADAERTLQALADGFVFTKEDITSDLDPTALKQLNDIRGYVGTGLSIRWMLWILVLIPLAVVAAIGGNGWAGRLKWAGGVAAISALIIYGGIAIAWSVNDIGQDYFPDYGARVTPDFRADYPRLSAELESVELNTRFERLLNSWQQGWRNQTVPWIVAGAVVFAIGLALPRIGGNTGVRMGGGPSYAGSSPKSSSPALPITKDRGDTPEGEQTEGEEPNVPDEPDPKPAGDSTA